MGDGLIQQIELAACGLPTLQVEQLAGCLDSLQSPDASGRSAASRLAANPRFQEAVSALWSAWAATPEISGPAVALALRAATATAEQLRRGSATDVVWTGPSTMHVPVRQSAQVLLGLINSSSRRLIVLSFAAYKVPVVVSVLRSAAARGVDVRLVLETKEDSKGRLTADAADAFEALHGVATLWTWPGAARPTEGAAMHAKAAVSDGETALVTSANLTGSALDRNMELGLLIKGGPVPRRLEDHFLALMAAGVLNVITGT
jgi:phosphatidylserine/phosphatidylglycerophosphate/cardiolipin synthase-like enzyme